MSASSEKSSTPASPASATAALLRREIDRLDEVIRDGSAKALSTLSDEHKLQAHLGLLEAKDRLSIIEPFTRSLASRIADRAHVAAETAALQIALANMDLHDFVEERTKRAKAELRDASVAARGVSVDAWRELELRIGAIGKELSKLV